MSLQGEAHTDRSCFEHIFVGWPYKGYITWVGSPNTDTYPGGCSRADCRHGVVAASSTHVATVTRGLSV